MKIISKNRKVFGAVGVVIVVGVVAWFILGHHHTIKPLAARVTAGNPSTSKTSTLSSTGTPATTVPAHQTTSNGNANPSSPSNNPAPAPCGGVNDTCSAPFQVTSAGQCNGSTQTTCIISQLPTQNKYASTQPAAMIILYGPAQSRGNPVTYAVYALGCAPGQCVLDGTATNGTQFTSSSTQAQTQVDFTRGTSSTVDVTLQAPATYAYTDSTQTPAVHLTKHFKNWVVNYTGSVNFSESQVYPAYSN